MTTRLVKWDQATSVSEWTLTDAMLSEMHGDLVHGRQCMLCHVGVSEVMFLAYGDSAGRHHKIKLGSTVLYEIDQTDGLSPELLYVQADKPLWFCTGIWIDLDTTDLYDALNGDSIEVRQGSHRGFCDATGEFVTIETTLL